MLPFPILPGGPTAQTPVSEPVSDSVAQSANHVFDLVVEGCGRFLELPLLALLAVIALVAALGAWWLRRRERPARVLRLVLIGLVIAGTAVVVDRKIAVLRETVANLRAQTRASITAMLQATGRQAPERGHYLYDAESAKRQLARCLGTVEVTPLIYDEATDVVQLCVADPPMAAIVTIVDLRCAGVGIEIGDSLAGKTMTSTFGRRNDCSLAINGEAGRSGRRGCGLGRWQGYLVRRGVRLLAEQPGNPRPFLWFDRHNHAAFVAGGAPVRELSDAAYNAIWGRVDVLVNGVAARDEYRARQPRTAMAIDAGGERLFLLVVDGRQERSWGMTKPEVGAVLQAFGAHDGMLCDEGGSSCLYLKLFGGVANVPSDKLGVERPTYTHFGITYSDQR